MNAPVNVCIVSLSYDSLPQAAAPKTWKGFDGKTTEMDTPFTIRAKELRDIYNSINMKYLTQDERLDVLLTLKHTVKVSMIIFVLF